MSSPSVGPLPTAPNREELDRRGERLRAEGKVDAAASDTPHKRQVVRLDRDELEKNNAHLSNLLEAGIKAPQK